METNSKFLKTVTNFKFSISYHDEVRPFGRFYYELRFDDWMDDSDEDFWDFDIEFNGYEIKELTKSFKIIQYGEFLSKLYKDFKEEHSDKGLLKFSKSECFDLLNDEIDMLNSILKMFYIDKVPKCDDPLIREEVLKHHSLVLIYSNLQKVDPDDRFLSVCIDDFMNRQKEIIESAVEFLKNKLQWLMSMQGINATNQLPTGGISQLVWTKSDTDLLELITALLEIKAINNSNMSLSRKDAINIFSKIFDRDIKDAESKLSRATERKKDVSPFLTSLKESFDNYAIRKEQK